MESKLDPQLRHRPIDAALTTPGIVVANRRAQRLARWVALATVVIPFLGVSTAVVFWWGRGVGPIELALLAGMFAATVIGIGAGFHRLVSHRAFQAHTAVKVTLCILGSMAAEGPVLFWAATHRRHHSTSDREGDPHSPHLHGSGALNSLRGFWHAHVGWMFTPETTGWGYYVQDLLKDQTIFAINRQYFIWVLSGLLLPSLLGGILTGTWRGVFDGFLWGGLVRVFLAHQTSWSINSVCHIFGRRAFDTCDQSTNNFWMALLSFGEGWHNNHHAFPHSAMHGLRWWEVDLSGYLIKLLKRLGLVWNVKIPTDHMIAGAQKK